MVPICPSVFQTALTPRHFNECFIETAIVKSMLATLDKNQILLQQMPSAFQNCLCTTIIEEQWKF